MISRERLDEILDDDNDSKIVLSDDVDTKYETVKLLRKRIPYDVCGRIIGGADHDIVYLPDVDEVLEYLSEDEVEMLNAYGVFVHDGDCLAMFV